MEWTAISKFFNQKVMTGIDIQPEGVQLAQLRHAKKGYVLEKLMSLPLEPGLFSDGKVMDWERLTALLFDWVREHGLVGSVAAVALPTHAVRLLCVDASIVCNELSLRACLEQELPGLGEAIAYDYSVMPVDPKSALVCVTRRDYLDCYLACLHEAGLDVKIIDAELFAVQRAMRCCDGAVLWQQRGKFTLIWQDDTRLPRQVQWPAAYGEQVVTELVQQLTHYNVKQLMFYGSTYYRDLFQKTSCLSDVIRYFTCEFNSSGVNMPDYLLALGLAMREVPAW